MQQVAPQAPARVLTRRQALKRPLRMVFAWAAALAW